MILPALSERPFRDALEVARAATFSPEEWNVYERAKMAEQDARGALAVARQEGLTAGTLEGKREMLLRLLTRAGIALTDDDRARIEGCSDAATLERWVENVLGAKAASDVFG